MKKMKKLVVLLLTGMMTCSMAACGGTEEKAESSTDAAAVQNDEKTDGEKMLIGVSLYTTGDVFDRILYEAMLEYADENSDKMELMVLNAQANVNTQLSEVEQLVNSGCDAIVMWPGDVDGCSPAALQVNEAGIPLVCVNTSTTEGEYVYVGSDDYESGYMQGGWLAENLPENATYCYLMGPIGHSGQIGRKKGVEDALEERTDVTMLAEMTGEWDRAKGMNITDDWLKAHPDVTAIVSQNDNMALGAVEAVRTANKQDDVIVVGTDATAEACASIAAGDLEMSVYQNAHDQGYNCIRVACGLVDGTLHGEDYLIPYVPVTQDNVEEYIAMYEDMESSK